MLGFILSPIEFVLVAAYAPLVSLKALESKTLNDDTNMSGSESSFQLLLNLLYSI